MSIIDKVVAAVTPPESEEARRNARAKALAAAGDGDWLSLVLEHHMQIETAFSDVKMAPDAQSRLAAQKQLAVILTGHSNAEEAVIYPALVRFGHKSHGMMGYTEQAGAQANLGELEDMDPLSSESLEKLEHVSGAVRHHMYEEENDRFLDLKDLSAADQSRLTYRFKEEFDRYMQGGANLPADDDLQPPLSTGEPADRLR